MDFRLQHLRRFVPAAAVAALALLSAAPAAAKPPHLKALGEHYGDFLPARLGNCSTCHQPPKGPGAPTSLADFPHNPFGKRVAAVAGELQRTDIAARLKAIAEEDADGDGVPNETELLAGRRPGDAGDRPTKAELAAAAKKRPAFLTLLSAYRWRPFEPVTRPAVPKVKDAQWGRNPIDAFIAAEREKRGLKPRPEARKHVLLRRVYLDLIGLSPTPEEQRAFVADSSPDAYEKVVDRLLASPHYGERWGRHWMDVWRYSDWAGWGEQVRDSQPHIWRWRDWIVDSLNADKGYDRMVREMLAGDELAPLDPDALRATGYLVRNYKRLSREKWMEDVVDHTGQAFLGITTGCARCHDHMYDPMTQREYYQLRAIFEPHQVRTDWVPGELDTAKNGLPRAFDAKPDAPTYFYVRGDERQPLKDQPLQPGVPAFLGGKLEIRPVPMPLLARFPEKQPHVIAGLREQAARRVEEARKAVQACKSEAETSHARLKLDAAEAARDALEAVLRVERLEDAGRKDSDEWKQAAAETVALQRKQGLADAELKRFEAQQAVDRLAAGAKEADRKKAQDALTAAGKELAKAEEELKAAPSTAYKPRVTSNHPAESTGRRLAFARWLTARENPLTARVAVNHIWLRHFGQPLLPTVNDFGRGGARPSHPQLLDWLAAYFMAGRVLPGEYGSMGVREYGSRQNHPHTPTLPNPHTSWSAKPWSMKQLHRLIVTSSAYRMASTPDPAALAKDPDNTYLWRMSSRRMDAEIVRDNVLWVAGELDPKLGGADIDQNQGLKVKRRTLYFRHAAEKEMVFTSLFDGPNVVECYRRKETVVPQQALALANSELGLVQARLLAGKLTQAVGPNPAFFARAAFERILARRATPAEIAECVKFLASQTTLLAGKTAPAPAERSAAPSVPVPTLNAQRSTLNAPSSDPSQRARENLVLVLLNHNDFVTIR
jgi:hypothetical protein